MDIPFGACAAVENRPGEYLPSLITHPAQHSGGYVNAPSAAQRAELNDYVQRSSTGGALALGPDVMSGAWLRLFQQFSAMNCDRNNPFAAMASMMLANHVIHGVVLPVLRVTNPAFHPRYVECNQCEGSGRRGWLGAPCAFCNGFGIVLVQGGQVSLLRRI